MKLQKRCTMRLSLKIFLLCIAWITGISGRILEDEIVAVIYNPEGSIAITRSDTRIGLDGQPRTLRQAILEQLMLLDAQKLKINITEDDVDRFLMQLQRQNGLTKYALEEMFRQLGFTYQEGREQLRNKQMIDTIVDYRVKSDKRMQVTPEEVEAYYQNNPLYSPMTVTLRQVFVSNEEFSASQIDAMIKDGTIAKKLKWEEPFVLEEQDIAEDKLFIKTAPLGSIVEREEDKEGIELTMLVERCEPRLIQLGDRYNEVEMDLRKERFFMLLREYEDKLLADATGLRFLNEADKKAVLG